MRFTFLTSDSYENFTHYLVTLRAFRNIHCKSKISNAFKLIWHTTVSSGKFFLNTFYAVELENVLIFWELKADKEVGLSVEHLTKLYEQQAGSLEEDFKKIFGLNGMERALSTLGEMKKSYRASMRVWKWCFSSLQ